ncbi:DUF723 domain-containing protein [Acinetobacter pittii]|uniref:DUF723 domain-containing protein n=1 Tax=Acinetobacter pittii TaxID=48296 RepID=UPI000838A43A|nr:DUF723 domain-containing protein [Acinetobacter pittii]MCK0789646.1 GIY-YIG nuclease family protein [Acinetobacter pittii]MCK0794792.1 GIY-YIG nuclease family protein [Acinetobacter pittii]MCK0801728.1 GIY-YIG nuclease family protein [Acinetobacter pittii]MCK0899890.1 GIY-YIG nuclease family protein [Acinetobacter pittii]OTM63018.1 hypothetical protein B9X99_19695 [Acinetobacter pittii]
MTNVDFPSKKIQNQPHQLDTQMFIDKSVGLYGDKFEYDCTNYINAKTKVAIRCKSHGVFSILPSNHYKKHGGCKACVNDGLRITDHIERFKSVHGERYDYSEFKFNGAREKSTIICSEHGSFQQTYHHHYMRKQGCPQCIKNRRLNIEIILEAFKKVHGDRYDYSLVEFKTNNRAKVKIVCKEHGIFEQQIASHLQGRNCPSCFNNAGWSRTDYIRFCEKYGNQSSLYLIELVKGRERFFKVGMTALGLKKRFSGKCSLPYKIKPIFILKADSGFIYDLESTLHRMLKIHKYEPNIKFEGHTECFSEIPKSVFKFIEQIDSSAQMQLIT